jgi:hypothetical protein
VVQERNEHDLMKDFEDEIPGYVDNRRLARALEETQLAPGGQNQGGNLRACYQSLVQAGLFPAAELDLVEAWLEDLDHTGGNCQ